MVHLIDDSDVTAANHERRHCRQSQANQLDCG